MNNNVNVLSRIKIKKFLITETGTYNAYYQRPWETHFNQTTVDNLTERVAEMDRTGTKSIQPELFSGLASNFVHPSTNPQNLVMLPNGWNEKRLRFLLEVELVEGLSSSGTIFYFQGYTDYLGATNSGNLDPEMLFIINSYVKVKRFNQSTQFGIQVKDIIAETAQIINGIIYSDGESNSPFKLRPYDVFSGIRSAYVTLNNQYDDDNNSSRQFFDTTIVLSPRETIKNSRNNNIASRYLSEIIDSHRHSQEDLEGFGGGEENLYERCSSRSYTDGPSYNEFIRCLSNITGRPNQTTFNYGDLLSVDQDVIHNTKCIILAPQARTKLVNTGDSAEWNSRDNETVMSSLLINSIPSLMVENFLTAVHLQATNYDGEIQIIVLAYESFIESDISQYIGRFKDAVVRQVLFDMTYGNQISFKLEMISDLMNNTSINISLDGGPDVLYNASSFCDSLLTPIIGSDKNTYTSLTNDVEHLLNTIKETSTSGANEYMYGNNSSVGFSI